MLRAAVEIRQLDVEIDAQHLDRTLTARQEPDDGAQQNRLARARGADERVREAGQVAFAWSFYEIDPTTAALGIGCLVVVLVGWRIAPAAPGLLVAVAG